MVSIEKKITLGNILTMLGMAAAVATLCFGSPGDSIRVEARVTAVEKAIVIFQQGQLLFQTDVRQQLTDIRSDMREDRVQNGVRWRELPPSPYQREKR